MKLEIVTRCRPELDPGFLPAVIWNRAFRRAVEDCGGGEPLCIALQRPNGNVSRLDTRVFPHSGTNSELNVLYIERLIKFLLWMKGGNRIFISGNEELVKVIAAKYSAKGERAFDFTIMGGRIYGGELQISACAAQDIPAEHETDISIGGNFDGCRIGFDLGGSDRKCAAVQDGKLVFSEEVAWDPYFQKDPDYHLAGIRDSLQRAAAKLPRVDAIGGSAAGVYVDNCVRIASLFRGVPEQLFQEKVINMFREIESEWQVPMIVVNDGEVTALAAAEAMGDSAVLGISMGTSLAAGYVNPRNSITDWLNELAFTPIDYRPDAPLDEWSGDRGCGVQYFSQQGVARLAPKAGFRFPAEMPFPEQLVKVQEAMAGGDERAAGIYRSIGTCFGYAVAHYAEFYEFRNLLILGRVSSGEGGQLILDSAREVLDSEFPELSGTVEFRTPDEKSKRHGQAVAAAGLAKIQQ